MRNTLRPILFAATCLTLAGCSREAEPPPPPVVTAPKPEPTAPPAPAPRVARAIITAIGDSKVGGEVTFTATDAGVSVEAHVNGLTPGKHGFHVHEIGDCSGDGTAAGPHFNPAAAAHGGPDGEVLHAGDLGNLEADATGHAMVTMITRHISLDEGAANSILGRSVLVHADADDLSSQPAGNSGARIACGLVTLGAATDAVPADAAPDATAPTDAAPADASAPAPASTP